MNEPISANPSDLSAALGTFLSAIHHYGKESGCLRLYDSKKDAARTSGLASTWQVPSSVHAPRGKSNDPSDMPASVAFDGRSGASSPPSTNLLR